MIRLNPTFLCLWRQVQAIENEVSGDPWQLKLFLLQGANQETPKCTHVVFIERYHIGPKISGKKKKKRKGKRFQIHLKQSVQLFPQLSGRTETQNAIYPLHPPLTPTLQTGFQVTQSWDLCGELCLEGCNSQQRMGCCHLLDVHSQSKSLSQKGCISVILWNVNGQSVLK